MLGIIIQLAISWLLVWLIERKHLGVLGLMPTPRRLADFGIFLIATALCAVLAIGLRMYFGSEQWGINPALTFNLVMQGLWWNIKSVLFEELIFRGVLLYILIKRLGSVPAIIISAVAFGVYHWFSFGILGSVPQMIVVFITTGLMGVILAYGYAKTLSLYIPIAIHLGWNLTHGFVFSQGPIGKGIFVVTHQPAITVSWTIWFIVMYVPLITTLAVNYWLIRKKKPIIVRKPAVR
ncbi:MAG TPA: type II CAAX endopeptidase family protein [Chitinophagaceae bacterium]|nr:type II CAAX endopeptidase family protein [Chitinophagaceae bacterium]